MDHSKIERVYEGLIAAGAGEAPLERALDWLAQAFGGAGSVVFELNRRTGAIGRWISPSLELGGDSYSERINAINPRMRYSMRHAAGHINYEHRFIDTANLERHEFYDWLKQSSGFRYFLGTRLFDEGDMSVFHSIEFDHKQDHPDTHQIAQFRRTSHALSNTWRVMARANPAVSGAELGHLAPNHLPWAIYVMGANGDVLHCNNAAAALLCQGDIVHDQDGVFGPCNAASNGVFQRALGAAHAGQAGDMIMTTPEPGGRRMIVQILPVERPDISALRPAVALVYIWDPLARAPEIHGALQRLWGLTPSEADLAVYLSNGSRLADAAAHLGVTRNTARNQLQSIFAKTHTHNQGELLRQLFGVLPGA